MMHHQDKENFFKERPMCGYLNACDAEIPAVEDSKVVRHGAVAGNRMGV